MKGKGERGGIFSSVFGNLLQRRGKRSLPKLLLTGSSGVLHNEPCYFHRCRGPDICPTGRAAAAVMAVLRSAVREEASGGEHVAAPSTCS